MIQILHKDEAYFSEVPGSAPGHNILRIAHERWGPKTQAHRTDMKSQSLVVVIEGQAWFSVPEQTWPLRAGTVFCFGLGGPHSFWCEPPHSLELYIVDIGGREATRVVREALGASRYAFNPSNPDRIVEGIQYMFSVAKSEMPLAHETCLHLYRALLLSIRSGLLTGSPHISEASSSFHACRRYMDQRFLDLHSPAEAANTVGVSLAYMCRLFRRFADTTPHRYLMRLKANYAANLLATTDMAVKQMAQHLGFSDQYAFSKSFKRLIGVAPLHYRRSMISAEISDKGLAPHANHGK